MINISPLHGQVLIHIEGDQSIGGLLSVDEVVAEGLCIGMVVRTGRGSVTREGVLPPICKKKDEVLFCSNKATRLVDGKEEYFLVQDSDVMSILSRDPDILSAEEWQVTQGIDLTRIIELVAQHMKAQVKQTTDKLLAEQMTAKKEVVPHEHPELQPRKD